MPATTLGDGLDRVASIRRYAPRELVFQQSDATDAAFYVMQGELKLYKLTPDGRRQVIAFLGEGEFIGFACGDEYSYSAEALTPVVVGRLPRLRLEQMAGESSALAARLFASARRELAFAHDQLLVLGRMTPLEKLASFLMRLAECEGRRGGDPEHLSLPMSRLDIADHLGLTIETVSRCFTKLRKLGIIQLARAADVVIRDPERLGDLASGDEDVLAAAA
jgi:CRP/FNR family transcriptional regulator